MNTQISINVAGKVANAIGAPVIICGNSDYSILFTFDTEWETLDVKTARFVFKKDGEMKFLDVVFSGRVVGVPVLSNIDEVYVGVYAGDVHTSTPARIVCEKSILCGTSTNHEEPDPDVYRQVLEVINNLETLPTVTSADKGRALMVNENGHWVVRLPDFMYDQNTGELIRFFFGTTEEWEAWGGDKANVLFVPTDLNVLDAIDEAFDKINSGETVVGKAKLLTGAEPISAQTDSEGKQYIPITKAGLYVVQVETTIEPTSYGTALIFVPSLDKTARDIRGTLSADGKFFVLYHTSGKLWLFPGTETDYVLVSATLLMEV